MGARATAEAVENGEILAGRFRVEAELGEGGMARVYRVVDLATQRPYALKLLKADVAESEEAVRRLRREAEVLSALDNPAIVSVETYGKLPDGRLFLVMELLEGETLGERMRRERRLDASDLAPIVAGVAAGLEAAHRAGVIHRDLKPDNIFLAQPSADAPLQVKLLDFGISKVYSNETRLTRTGQVLGTPRYMAPEQLSAEPDLDARVDVYALGVILYEALAGSPPFVAVAPSDLIVAILHGKASPLRSLRPDVAPSIESIVSRAMARARDARFATAKELAEAWLGVAGARSARAAGTRLGMRTDVLGSAGAPLAAEDEADAAFRPGTFSELEEARLPQDDVETAAGVRAKREVAATAPPAVDAPEVSGEREEPSA
ncbi:MAG TPA: serine/threonine-protein kinase, partial [Polyangiaceae bacterium LLY-WYZ-15_(1-7)]|nr:serine/threonine-protein kinase [Polyangiaceae bacterium LLY-WYZ-15_(1-7)]